MTVVVMRPCGHPGCSTLIDATQRWCTPHIAEHPAWGKRWAGSTTDRGYGWAWERLRKRILKRDRYVCLICKVREATDVDHIVPKAKGGTDDPANLQSLCRDCHKAKTAKEDSKK